MRSILFYIICILVIVVAVWIGKNSWSEKNAQTVYGQVICEGKVAGEPDRRGGFAYVILKTDESCNEIKIRAKVAMYPEFFYGDRVRLEGKIALPEDFETETGRTFHYQAYLFKDDITAVSFYPKFYRIEAEKSFSIPRSLFFVKRFFVAKLNQIFPSPHAELLGGLIVGAKQSLGDQLLEDFRRVGLIHIVVLSGFNVVIIIKFVMYCLSTLPRKFTILITVIFVILFAMMVGLNPPIVRASIMALISLWGMSSYREYNVHRAFFLTVTIMVIQNPMIVIYDPSFQLSALATAGLLYIGPIFDRLFQFITLRFGVREIFTATCATYVSVLPFLIYMMGEVSIVSLVVNLLVLPIIPITMLVGFLSGMLFWLPVVSTIMEYATYIFLSYELWIVEHFAKLSFATIKVPAISGTFVIISYVIIIAYLFYSFRKVIFDDAPV